MKKIFLAVLLILVSLVSFSFEQLPNNFQTRYWLYFSPDGIDSWTNFSINFTSEDYFLDKESDIKYKVDIEYKNKIIEDDIYGQELKFNNLELEFKNIKIQLNQEKIKLYPTFIMDNLYLYYKDLNGKYLDNRYMIAYNNNQDINIDNIIKDDEFGIGYEAEINKNEYEIDFSYINEIKEKESSIDSKYTNVVENNYELVEFENDSVITYKYNKDDFSYVKDNFEYNDIKYLFDLNIDMKSGLLKGFKTDSLLEINYDYDFGYNENQLTVDYLKSEIEDNSNSATNTIEQESFTYKVYNDYSKEIDYNFLSDTYYEKSFIGKGLIFKPNINLYLKDGYYIVTNAYDHFMKLRYDFKGLSSMDATSTTLSLNTFLYGKDYNINILNGIQFKLNDDNEVDNAFYFDINNIYRGFDNFRTELRIEYFNSEEIKNLTVTPRIFANYKNFKLNIEDYIDYDITEEEFINTYMINPYYSIDDLELGIKIFNSKYRAFGDAYYREFLTKTDNLNWYIYLEFLKYFYL
ncbi:MAG: hypothetical protein ACQESN_07260 [Thermotogota bacterium]